MHGEEVRKTFASTYIIADKNELKTTERHRNLCFDQFLCGVERSTCGSNALWFGCAELAIRSTLCEIGTHQLVPVPTEPRDLVSAAVGSGIWVPEPVVHAARVLAMVL